MKIYCRVFPSQMTSLSEKRAESCSINVICGNLEIITGGAMYPSSSFMPRRLSMVAAPPGPPRAWLYTTSSVEWGKERLITRLLCCDSEKAFGVVNGDDYKFNGLIGRNGSLAMSITYSRHLSSCGQSRLLVVGCKRHKLLEFPQPAQ